MPDFKRGTVRANNLTFTYLTEGDGPLALCLPGFPDSPYSYRYLLPALEWAAEQAAAWGKDITQPTLEFLAA
jgi:hypothetical protein